MNSSNYTEKEPSKKEESKNSTAIALITQDIKYIKHDLSEIKGELKAVLGHYIHREEYNKKLEEVQLQIDNRIIGIHERIKELCDEKLDISDFEPYQSTQKIIKGVVVTAIVGALLSLILIK
jgi:hypothetical protein